MSREEREKEETMQRIKELEAQIESITVKPPNKYWKAFSDSSGRAALNVIQDLPTTLTGLGVAAGVMVVNYPNIDSQILLEAIGFSGLGGISNSKGHDFNEFG